MLLSEIINSANLSTKNFRVKFEKAGVAKYISHLDLNRIFSRAIARAGIEVAHSEGFNPHPKIAFVSALSLGTESFCEFADMKIIDTDNISESEIFDRLKNVFPSGINIKEVYAPKLDFKYIDRTRFYIFVKPTGFGASDLEELFSGDVTVEKKPGIVINLRDYTDNIAISDGDYIKIDAVVKTNREMFLNPENIIKGVNAKYIVEDYFIQKIEMYDKDLNIFV